VQIRYHAVNPVELRVVPVGAAVVLQEQENEKPARHAHCETKGVEQGIAALGPERAEGDFEVVLKHN